MTLQVILAVHDRRELSVRAVRSMAASAARAGVDVRFTVFDDGSTDGTAEALTATGLPITVLPGDGSAYWAASMARAEAAVLPVAAAGDWIVWLNDDVEVDPGAVAAAMGAGDGRTVLVGAMRDPDTGAVTYGGLRRRGIHPLRFDFVPPREVPLPVDTFNGNLVFVPIDAARALGGIDGGFAHALADFDYGWRATRAGIPVVLLPGTLGACARNPVVPWRGVGVEWRAFRGIKGGGHPGSLRRILRRNAPLTWPLFYAGGVVLWWFRALRRGVRR